VTTLRAHDWRWRADGGYYTSRTEELERQPLLPDPRDLRDVTVAALFARFLPDADAAPAVLELGCGASRWMPYLAVRHGCRVTGLDYEPGAAELARANLRGAGVEGQVLCRDAFASRGNEDLTDRFDLVYSWGLLEHFADVVSCLRAICRYLRPGGVMLTTVPNLQGVNWALQRLGDLSVLQTHVIYDAARLRERHEEAGLQTLAWGYAGFYNGFVSALSPRTPPWRRRVHRALCRSSNLAAYGWLRLTRGHLAPRLAWLSPTVYYVGRAG
jgi:2-polyprenyl-6-hydroxyphenyl methylase/3-demethylubiquinone-9 3-methyltransferase